MPGKAFGVCANANETCPARGAETKAVCSEEASSFIDSKPRKENGRSASAPRKSSGSRSENRAALIGFTLPPAQFESRQFAYRALAGQLTSAAVCLAQPRFPMDDRDSGISEKLLGMADVL